VLQKLIEAFGSTIDLRAFLLRMVAAAFLAFVAGLLLAWFPPQGGPPRRLLRLLPLLTLSMALVTTVVASSLAVAIGMVGAMSVVRFRHLLAGPKVAWVVLLSMALGLSAGIGQILPALGLLVVLGMVLAWQSRRQASVFIIKVSGKPGDAQAWVREMAAAYPLMQIQYCQLASDLAEWTFAHPNMDLDGLVQLRSFMQRHAPSMTISWTHAD
jgi:hypothetical protein